MQSNEKTPWQLANERRQARVIAQSKDRRDAFSSSYPYGLSIAASPISNSASHVDNWTLMGFYKTQQGARLAAMRMSRERFDVKCWMIAKGEWA